MDKENSKNAQTSPRDSAFTLTFAIEILGMDVWHDCNDGWLDLGACVQGMRIQYQLYPGQCFDLDILIWPHVAKIWYGSEHCFVRTWQFLERRWLAFTIRHVFPVRVLDMINHVATITPCAGIGALSANAKNDKNVEAYLPPLKFAEMRYFGRVIDKVESLEHFIQNLIWKRIKSHIPSSYLDGPFNSPQRVTDIRHQNEILKIVRDTILNKTLSLEKEETINISELSITNNNKKTKGVKEKEKRKKVDSPKQNFELKLSGNTILAGTSQIVAFENVGESPADLGEIISIISSNNLPAQDDIPILFVIVKNLMDAPVKDLQKLRITHLYTKWKIGDEKHCSQKQHLQNKENINFNDFNTLPLSIASEITSTFLDNPFEIQLRGIQHSDINIKKSITTDIEDVFIAVTKINAGQLAKQPNGVIKEEYSLYPFDTKMKKNGRKDICTNDINCINRLAKPQIVVPASIILTANMTLEVTIGVVGCKPRHKSISYLRLFCLVSETEIIEGLIKKVTDVNKDVVWLEHKEGTLTGFAINTGEMTTAYIEGPGEGFILEVWKFTEAYADKMKVLFSSSDKYSNRVYPEMLSKPIPFTILKMFAPLNCLLACPAVYVSPALPTPAKTCLLKIGQLISNNLKLAPNRSDMPTFEELASFRLEMCVALKSDFTCSDVLNTDLFRERIRLDSV